MRLLRRLAQRIEKLSDLRQPIATAPQLPCDLGVAHTLRTVFAITRCLFALGAQDAVLFPCAQCRRVNAETARQLTHRQRWTVHQCRCHGGQSPPALWLPRCEFFARRAASRAHCRSGGRRTRCRPGWSPA